MENKKAKDGGMQITGLMVYYYFVCKRKLWYFLNDIRMEQNSEAVEIGKVLDNTTYPRDTKHINIDQTINIDFIRETNVLHEVKKSRKMEEASIWQVKYYIYYLKTRGVEGITGKIDYPLLKRSVQVELTAEDEVSIAKILEEIIDIMDKEYPPSCQNQKICKKCAYFDLCYI
ncbi:MAG: CRISPR-associated protein Cas4 [Lachnospiraceae bacterium]|nr:CRISPR-associated protein Cas4 [Lachnospiraceae bacterium]